MKQYPSYIIQYIPLCFDFSTFGICLCHFA